MRTAIDPPPFRPAPLSPSLRMANPVLAARPPSGRASYGYARAEVLAAFVNALKKIEATYKDAGLTLG